MQGTPNTMEYNDGHPAGSGAGPSTGGLNWTNDGPILRMEDAVVETVVTHTTRTTTSFQPITLPRIPPPEHIKIPDHLPAEKYPLAGQPTPTDMHYFTMMLGGRRVIVQDENAGPIDDLANISGPGWTRDLLSSRVCEETGKAEAPVERMGFVQALSYAKGKEKKRHFNGGADDKAPAPLVAGEGVGRQRSPPRKKIRGLEDISIAPGGNRALLSPLPSPEHDSIPLSSSSTYSSAPNMGSGNELAALFSLPTLVNQFDALPDRLQQHLLMHLLRRSRMPTLQRISGFVTTALRRDFITQLPHEVAVQILKNVDGKALAIASGVCKRWKRMIDNERSIWKQSLVNDHLWSGYGTEEQEESLVLERYSAMDLNDQLEGKATSNGDEQMMSEYIDENRPPSPDRPAPLKHVYRRRYQDQKNWVHTQPEHTSFTGLGTSVVTCLQFDEDKIISASDDSSINIYNTKDGQLRKTLEGHEGGVWTLQYKGQTLVSGSTDRTVRVWDLEDLRMTYVFAGHTSTVRCLQIVEPVWEEETQSYQPEVPMIVTGSRDATLRVWKLPQKDDPLYDGIAEADQTEILSPESNPFHVHLLEGHTLAVRSIATHGRICVSGSYDMTVRVWDIVTGTCLNTLVGHEAKVYSIVYDPYRKRCASGSMDNTVKVWDVVTGECLHTLQGHTSLVGLLGLSPNYLVSAAADSSLRIWDPNTCDLKSVLGSYGGAITCFQHDETKVVSGSEGTLKLWDIKTGAFVRDLVVGISSVWQVAFNGNLLVAASNRNNATVFDVFKFGQPSTYAVDDPSLDGLQPPRWERWAMQKQKEEGRGGMSKGKIRSLGPEAEPHMDWESDEDSSDDDDDDNSPTPARRGAQVPRHTTRNAFETEARLLAEMASNRQQSYPPPADRYPPQEESSRKSLTHPPAFNAGGADTLRASPVAGHSLSRFTHSDVRGSSPTPVGSSGARNTLRTRPQVLATSRYEKSAGSSSSSQPSSLFRYSALRGNEASPGVGRSGEGEAFATVSNVEDEEAFEEGDVDESQEDDLMMEDAEQE